MKVVLMGHTQFSYKFGDEVDDILELGGVSDGQGLALTAIRTCYSHNKPSEIIEKEGPKYFGKVASDGGKGNDADRLIRHIVNSGHSSTLEHLSFTFAIEGVSRSLLAQITRHRHFSFSVQSQRYNKLETGSKSGGFDYVMPPSVEKSRQARNEFEWAMNRIQEIYDEMREVGVPAEDARFVLPNAATCNLVLTGNLRSFLEFNAKRSEKGAQWEIRELSELIKNEIVQAEPWVSDFFK